jgi:nucleoside-diphosphate-sugar epimerase
MANSSKVLITGSGGFLGSHMAESFLKEGSAVVGIDNYSSTPRRNTEYLQKKYPTLFKAVEADVCKEWKWASDLGKDFQYVFHMASPASPPIYQELALETLWVNSIGLNRALEYADSVRARLVFMSTSEIYGDPEVHPQPESYRGNVNTFGPRACYDEAKRFGEALLYTYNWKKKTQHGLVRIFNTYGPRMNPADGRVVINFLAQALRGENLTVYGDGQQTRSFCFVDDLIAGIRSYAKSNLTVPSNIGNPTEFTVLQLAEIIQKELFPQKNLKIVHKELPVDDPTQRCPDISFAKSELGWEPKVLLRDGLKVMAQWLSQELGIIP